MPSRPLLLIDVDGVISLFGFEPRRPPKSSWQLVDGIAHLLSATAGGHLNALAEAFELVWCSGWEEKANDYLPLALGLDGPLPFLRFPPPGGRPTDDGETGPADHWKLAAIDAFAGPNRPLAWIDDGHDEACRRWAAARPGATLLISTEPAVGLTAEQVSRLTAWSSQLHAGENR